MVFNHLRFFPLRRIEFLNTVPGRPNAFTVPREDRRANMQLIEEFSNKKTIDEDEWRVQWWPRKEWPAAGLTTNASRVVTG
jgi:hypothetical protein